MTLFGLDPDHAVTPESWEAGGIPWAAAWMKDMIQWGTLDPVAAYGLARQMIDTREEAHRLAAEYFAEMDEREVGDPLDPALVRGWMTMRAGRGRAEQPAEAFALPVELSRRIVDPQLLASWRVVPHEAEGRLDWADVAGFVLASSPLPEWWGATRTHYDFALNAPERVVKAIPYL